MVVASHNLFTNNVVSFDIHRKTGFAELVCSGGFRNRRQVYSWEGFTLELDETRFEHGTLYEIEVETVREAAS